MWGLHGWTRDRSHPCADAKISAHIKTQRSDKRERGWSPLLLLIVLFCSHCAGTGCMQAFEGHVWVHPLRCGGPDHAVCLCPCHCHQLVRQEAVTSQGSKFSLRSFVALLHMDIGPSAIWPACAVCSLTFALKIAIQDSAIDVSQALRIQIAGPHGSTHVHRH